MNQNNDVWLSLLRSLVVIVCGSLVTKGLITADQAPMVQTLLLTAIPALVGLGVTWWGAHTQTEAAKLIAVAANPAVQKIVVNDNAGDGVGKAAADPAQLKVLTESADKQSGTGS